jgi:transcriptional regulator with XRE-family HTH domain
MGLDISASMNMDPGTWAASVATVVRAEMTAQHRSTRDLALVLGVTGPTARLRLQGRKPFDLAELERVAAWLSIPPSELLVRAADRVS